METGKHWIPLHTRFAYAFISESPHHWPFLSAHELGSSIKIGDIDVVSFIQEHGAGTTLGSVSVDSRIPLMPCACPNGIFNAKWP